MQETTAKEILDGYKGLAEPVAQDEGENLVKLGEEGK